MLLFTNLNKKSLWVFQICFFNLCNLHLYHATRVISSELWAKTILPCHPEVLEGLLLELRVSLFKSTHRWSMETKPKSNLCFDLNMTSLWGISNMDGGPNGVHKQNRARGASSVFLFWPFRTLSFPLMSNRCKEKENKYVHTYHQMLSKWYQWFYSVQFNHKDECVDGKVW